MTFPEIILSGIVIYLALGALFIGWAAIFRPWCLMDSGDTIVKWLLWPLCLWIVLMTGRVDSDKDDLC